MNSPQETTLIFSCADANLIGILHPAADGARSTGVVFVVGGPQYRVGSHRQFVLMARALAQAGFPVLRFDYRGMGDSDGKHAGFESCGEDVRAAVDTFVRECPGVKHIALFGLCDGASAVLMHCVTDARITRLILANPWIRTEGTQAATVLRHYYWRRPFQRSFWAKLGQGGVQIRKSLAEFASNLRRVRRGSAAARSSDESFVARMLAGLRSFRGPALFLLSGQDLTAREFADVCARDEAWQRAVHRPDITWKEFPGADHTLSARTSLNAATDACVDWLERLEAAEAKASAVQSRVDRVA
jgi:exosortase A-associated hydrolase 1